MYHNFTCNKETSKFLKGIYIFFVAMTSKKHKLKKGESPFLFHHKKRTKGQFWLQIIILHKGTGVSFKTNTSLASRVIKITSIKSIWTTKGTYVTSF